MRRIPAIMLTVTAMLAGTSVNSAEVLTLKCEEWHPRLGQMADKTIAIDSSAKTCNAQPCAISDTELKWTDQNGRVVVVVNRTAGEGTVVYEPSFRTSRSGC